MTARVKVEKSFDDGRTFTKELSGGDFREFFTDEGQYLDRLVDIVRIDGDDGDSFTVSYTVTVER